MTLDELLGFSVSNNASDLHLSAGLPPMIRVDGDVRRINVPPLEHKQVHGLIYDIMNDKQRKDYDEFLECDFSFEIPKLARFASTPSIRIAARRRVPHDSHPDHQAWRIWAVQRCSGI
jgi:Tfp pilus assembly pilus retraction ATPase PilT